MSSMFRVIQGNASGLSDVEKFFAVLNSQTGGLPAACRDLWALGEDLFVSRAPGRLDVMGGIADYSGSLVLQLPIREATHVALQRQDRRILRIVTLTMDHGREPVFEMPLSEFEADGGPVSYEIGRAYFQKNPANHWAAYVAGAFLVLMRERGAKFNSGATILVSSDVPEGKGVSSSAAIEVAVMQAVASAFGIVIEARELAILCQKVENLVVGAPCGVMDQMSSACGQANKLLALLCQPAELQDPVEIPAEIEFWGLDSGVRHSVSGADYGSVRIGAFMGYRIIAELAGLRVEPGNPVRVEDPVWHRCLANVSPSEYEQRFAAQLPVTIRGEEFLSRYGGTTDSVTVIDPRKEYAVRMPARHPVYEHYRVRTYREMLMESPGERRLELLGEMMYQSHASYSACGLGCEGTDRLVTLVREMGPTRGLYGAKITGGGSGGTVAVLGRRGSDAAVREVVDRYERLTGYRSYVFSGSSPGAAAFGILRLKGE